jgi:SAM-dependent methyltransferase
MSFIVSDYESLGMEEQFDCAVFYDSLHHAVDENTALKGVYRALKPGGVCITVEPGKGHHLSRDSQNAIVAYGVTEKEMPPCHIIRIGEQIGFSRFKVYRRRFEPVMTYDSEPVGFLEHLGRVIPEIIHTSRLFWRSRKLLNGSSIVALYK